MLRTLVVGFTVSGLAGFLAFRGGTLSSDGALAATVVGTVIFAGGGFAWLALLAIFFLSSSALSRLAATPTLALGDVAAKSDRRDAGQVLANGGVAALCALGSLLSPTDVWHILYAAALASATADTWATEIGRRSVRTPRHILTGRPMRSGVSGGVTLAGFTASALGALLLGLASVPLLHTDMRSVAIITLAGFSGSVFDSLLGGTVQELRLCPICHVRTEQKVHLPCDTPTSVVRGCAGIDNDFVNAASCGAALAVALLAGCLC